MAPAQRGAVDSGLDRGLEWAQKRRLDTSLLSGSQFPGDERPVTSGQLQPWQRLIGSEVEAPGTTAPKPVGAATTVTMTSRPSDPKAIRQAIREAGSNLGLSEKESDHWAFKPNLTGVVVVHGIGPQLAGQTLLDWSRPIITALGDAVAADRNGTASADGVSQLAAPDPADRGITDPVYKSNIDFSGETFPVVQIRIPRRRNQTPEEAAADPPLWVFTETWWASEVRPPTLRTMVGWLGEQGGVGRIVQGIQANMFGSGRLRDLAAVSVQPFVSVIVSFALLLLIAGLAITRLIPVESIRSAAALKLASTFLTDWFGGARTLLRDPAQSANVRHRLVETIKALRAYGCQRVVLISHSGGTIVSLQTLTDPAYPDLHVDKLITHGEAMNLGWRLEASDPDASDPVLAPGNRMLGNLADDRRLIWRDFFGTHDPAPCGPPDPPEPMRSSLANTNDRFTTERTYNQMSILGDHGGYWDNDEHFVIPVIREIDVPNGDRSTSRFWSDEAESAVRARRKERLSFLRLWRRGTNALPIMAILAAAIVTGGGYLPALGRWAMGLLGQVPVVSSLGDAGRSLSSLGGTTIAGIQPFDALYGLGLLVLHAAFTFAVLQALIPSGVAGLWWERPGWRTIMRAIDWGLGLGAFVLVMFAWVVAVGASGGLGAVGQLVRESTVISIAVAGFAIFVLARIGRWLRRELRQPRARMRLAPEVIRGLAILASAAFLGGLLVLLAAATLGVVLVFAGSDARPASDTIAIREFVLGAFVALGAFNLLQRIGGWRWESWDVRERYSLRRRPLVEPSRWWATLVAATLTVIAIAGAFLVAVGTDEASPPPFGRAGWTGIVIALAIGLIVLAIGKDVVDNDVEVDGRFTGGAAAGEPSPGQVQPAVSGRAAGTT